MPKYLIKSIGRTGSHIIGDHFRRLGFKYSHIHYDGEFEDAESKENFNTAKNLVAFCHAKDFIPPNSEKFILISSIRKNKFDQYCSFKVAEKINQWTQYRKTTCEPIIIDEELAKAHMYVYEQYASDVKTQSLDYKWKRFVEIYYEDIKDSPKRLFKLFPFRGNYDRNINPLWEKSPYNYEELIVDYQQHRKNLTNN